MQKLQCSLTHVVHPQCGPANNLELLCPPQSLKPSSRGKRDQLILLATFYARLAKNATDVCTALNSEHE